MSPSAAKRERKKEKTIHLELTRVLLHHATDVRNFFSAGGDESPSVVPNGCFPAAVQKRKGPFLTVYSEVCTVRSNGHFG